MGIREGLLALLANNPKHGYQLKAEFESATAGVWPLNIGQVYSTLDRLERDGLVNGGEVGADGRKPYQLTEHGRGELEDWFSAADDGAPQRDGLMIKVLIACNTVGVDPMAVIDTQRAALLRNLQENRRAQRKALAALDPMPPATPDSPTISDLTAALLFDALIAKTEGELRWLELCEERLRIHPLSLHTDHTARTR